MIETRLSPAYEFKATAEPSGVFQGLASTFNGPVDSYGEIVAPGAFADSLAEHRAAGTTPVLLWQHQSAEPVGRWVSIVENKHGLAVEGRLSLGTRRGAEAYALLKDGALTGLSIGFRVKPDGASYNGSNRVLKSLDLVEISLVSLPANPAARVTAVKSAAFPRPENIREFEAALRDACGFSAREAKRIASAGWVALMRRDDASGELKEIAALLSKTAVDFQPHQ